MSLQRRNAVVMSKMKSESQKQNYGKPLQQLGNRTKMAVKKLEIELKWQ